MSASTFEPVLVGIAQLEQRDADPVARTGKEPLDLMIDSVRAAAEDAGAPSLLASADAVRVIRGMWPYEDPAKAVAEALGCPGAETGVSMWGGDAVQLVLTESALDIQGGAREIVILVGAECGRTQAKARRAGIDLQWREAPGNPDRTFGEELKMRTRAEAVRGVSQPIQMYPIFENAIRHARGETLDGHIRRVSELWAGFSRVAAGNPHAWIREPMSAAEIRTPSDLNRPVSFPYPKLMNSNSNVDQAAALILCSTEVARRLGVPEDKWVYPWAATAAHDTYAVSNRDNLHSSPGIRVAGGRALELADLEVDDIAHVDLYSCFPSAVQVAAAELGLGEERPLTVTGGLTFGGGPLNNYVMHAIARMGEVLRDSPGDVGLVSSNGGFITKHAFGVYSTAAPAKPFRYDVPQDRVDAMPTRESVPAFDGPVEIESYTVMYGANGPSAALAACLLEDGRRAWGNTDDPEAMQAMVSEEFCGRPARLREPGTIEF
ncbi:MAG: acetyl-CoA acetyltransferase [Gammaproteobacteria bacterium]|nr:acetyl-CoA acetyltransferase [Gammaproteobacteria bacterium]